MSREPNDSDDEIGFLLGGLGSQHGPTDTERQRVKQRIIDELAGHTSNTSQTDRSTDSAELIRVIPDQAKRLSTSRRKLLVAVAVVLLGLGSLGLVALQGRPPQSIDATGYTLAGPGVANLPVPVAPGTHEVVLAGQVVRFELLRDASLIVRGADHIVLEADGGSRFTLALTEQAFDGVPPNEWFTDKDFNFQESGDNADGLASSRFDVFLSSQDQGTSGCVTAEPCIAFAQVGDDPNVLALQLGVSNRISVVAASDGGSIIGFENTQSALPEEIVRSVAPG